MTEKNRAAWLDGKDRPFRIAEAPIPRVKANHVVIRNRAIAINPIDWKVQGSGAFIHGWPIILGSDVAGEVIEVGSEVTNIKKGDRACAHSTSLLSSDPDEGGFQLYTSCSAATTTRIPEGVTFRQACVLPLGLDTAATGLYDVVENGCLGLDYPSLDPKASGTTIVVYGGSSSVGAQATMLAVASGAKVIAVASQHNFEFCKSLGALDAFDYKSPTIVDDIVEAVRVTNDTFIGVLDAIFIPESFRITVSIVEKLGGGQLTTVLPGPEKVPYNVRTGTVFAVNPVTHPVWRDYILPALEQGRLKCLPEPMVIGKGLEEVQAGCDVSKAGVSAKKVVVEL